MPAPHHNWSIGRSVLGATFVVIAGSVFASGLAQAQSNAPQGGRAEPDSTPRSARWSQSLDGRWELSTDGGQSWRPTSVPGTFESQIGPDFDGVADFRRAIEPIAVADDERLIVEFSAVGTAARVWLDDQLVGQHLGGWTPFRIDITDASRARQTDSVGQDPGAWLLRVEVDERVDHLTQGFLPIIAPHFGGIWQSVTLRRLPAVHIDELKMMAIGDPAQRMLVLDLPIERLDQLARPCLNLTVAHRLADESQVVASITGSIPADDAAPAVSFPTNGRKVWIDREGAAVRVRLPIANPQLWSPGQPHLYDVDVELVGQLADGRVTTDRVSTTAAFRSVAADGTRLLVNGQTVGVRGVLNWGYQPHHTGPTIDEQVMRREIEQARAMGFNLMKFCLWVPPRRYLQLCDEAGLMAWIEYPTWHAEFSPATAGALQREYDEFFFHDRNHPCVVLRSLTCETGHSADVSVLQGLYDQCRQRVPGALVEDDSSWIEWQRVFDFYDDHPYGNNHTWVAKLRELDAYRAARQAKPLVLGEAIAADTWTDPQWFAAAVEPRSAADSTDRPAWSLPWALDANRHWLTRTPLLRPQDLAAQSRHYAMLMRKFQIEAFRRELPDGGYVVSVIRDFPKASMGLIDYRDEAKWSPADWAFQGDTMLILSTENDRRSFFADAPIGLSFHASHLGPNDIDDASLTVSIEEGAQPGWRIVGPQSSSESAETSVSAPVELAAGELSGLFDFTWHAATDGPARAVISARLSWGDRVVENRWPIWVFPRSSPSVTAPRASRHPSWAGAPGLAPLPEWDADGADIDEPVVTSVLDDALLRLLSQGGRVLMIPNGERGSFPLADHWFLRGGPALCAHPLARGIPTFEHGSAGSVDMFTELQHFDLAGRVIPRIDGLVDRIAPIVVLWDNHDLSETLTHGLLFEVPVGDGRMLVSALEHGGADSAAGQWLFQQLLDDLRRPAEPNPRGAENLARLSQEVSRREIALEQRSWQFRPDPDTIGASEGWSQPAWDDSEWDTIRANRHWEGQGHETLDGWGWYRLTVDVPADFAGQSVWLNFTGADDYYDAYVAGEKVGSGGNIERRETAFDLRASHDISRLVVPGQPLVIAVAVYDWYGAGGLFRPVSLSTAPLSDEPAFLK